MSKKIYFLLSLIFGCFSIIHAQTIDFQDTKGELTIDGSGSANYKVPIALPPGIKDIAPQISLSYSSSGNNGVAGYGWNITGISSINRIGTRIDIDGHIDPVDFDDNDQFVLDGNRLIKQADNSLKTENYSNQKIVINNGNLNSPDYFIVYSPDGSISYYGNIQNSKGITEWLITKWVDTNGNTIKYEYTSESNVINLSKIIWAENEKKNTNYQNTMEFIYKSRARPESAYLHGNNLVNKKILDYIVVKTNGVQFKKYVLTHRTNNLNYQVVLKIQEFNEINQGANPIIFDYNTTAQIYLTPESSLLGVNNVNSTSKVLSSGDFDGDGKMDAIIDDKLYLDLYAGIDGKQPKVLDYNLTKYVYNIPTLTTLENNKLLQMNALLKEEQKDFTPTNDYNVNANHTLYLKPHKLNTTNSQFEPLFTRSVKYPNIGGYIYPPSGSACNTNNKYKYSVAPTTKYIEGDFNGDGISEVLLLGKVTSIRFIEPPKGDLPTLPGSTMCKTDWNYYDARPVLIDMNPRISDNDAVKNISMSNHIGYDSNVSIFDFNGDGKQDIFSIAKDGTYYVQSFSQLTGNFEQIASGKILDYKIDEKTNKQNIVFGDYNGDSKTDFLVSQAKESSTWSLYLSTGNSVIKSDVIIEPYIDTESGKSHASEYFYYALDIDSDGKSDLVRIKLETHKKNLSINNDDSYYDIKMYSNITSSSGIPSFNLTSSYFTGDRGRPFPGLPIVGNFKTHAANYQFMVMRDDHNANTVLDAFRFKKNQSTDARLISVKESSGTIEQHLEYTRLDKDNNTIYNSANAELYPNVELTTLPEIYVVSKQTFKTHEKSKYRLFQYRGLTSNYTGLGLLGFKKVAQSSWIVDGINDESPVWNVSQMDPNKRGVNSISWSFSGTNTNLIDSYTDSDLLSKTTNSYTYSILPDKRFILLPQSITNYDFISGVITTTENTFDNYYNIATTTETKTANGKTFKSTTTNTVENLPSSSPYIIGRLIKEVSKVDAYGGSYTSQKEYTYDNNNIAKTITTVQNEGIQVIDYTYDTYGNVLTITDNGKTTSGLTERIAARKIENIYDTNGRFVIKKKDTEGYETNLEYNLLGQITKETDKFGAVTSTEYDNWGKLLKVTLSGSSTTPIITQYQYTRDFPGWSIISSSDQTKAYSAQYFDFLGNNIKNTIKGFSDKQYISTSTEYDFLGRKLRESQPYFSSPSQWTTYEYDYLLRPTKVTNHTGLIATNTYNGLTTTTKEGVRSKKITKDAIGNTAQLVDNETETINYAYNPNGTVKTTTYGSHVITTGYDVWGRRTSLFDPSVSSIPYTYSFTAFDEIKEEKMPEGTTTYKYDAIGKITEKTTTGKSNISIKYTYDTTKKGLLIREYGTNEGNSFSNDITYDNYFRIAGKNEITPKYVFGKQIVYDEFGRIMNSESWTMTNNKRIQTVILNHQYNQYNGELNLLLDISKGVGKVVWKANAKNERGQTLNATLGELITVQNTYDAYGNITNINNKKGDNWLYNVNYEYQVDRGLLTKRTDSHFAWEEKFTYDSFDRLLSWSSPNGTNYNTYLTDGRIDINNQVGKYAYNSTAKYKKQSIQLNAPGNDYYSKRKEQSITYDAFKRPLTISEVGRGNVNFQYGINGGRYYALKQDLLANKTTQKYYSQDGTMDISVDQNGNTKIINYISSPYDTPFIYVTELNSALTTTKEGYHYLARDFQGSVMAIYDANANVVERRLFDPWGNIVKVQDANGNVTEGENAKLIFLDRGYTGHEHFTEVGIIHMNGRIYDPMLKQFLSPDNFIQDPENSQSYNRYGYAWNNPLKFTDPSGETVEAAAFVAAVIVGAIIGAATYTMVALTTWTQFTPLGLLKSIATGAVSGAVSFGIGSISASISSYASSNISSAFLANTISHTSQALLHGISQGFISGISGGDFGQTFISSLVASAVAGGVQGVGNIAGMGDSGFRTILFGTVSGGLSAELTGGNFWQGAATGLIVSALSHTNHRIINNYLQNDEKINANNQFNSQEDLENYITKNIGDFDRIEKELKTTILLATNSDKPVGYSLRDNGFLETPEGDIAGGTTSRTTGFTLKKSRIYISPGAKALFKGIDNAKMIISHELIHAYHLFKGLSNYNTYTEAAASTYTYRYYSMNGLKRNALFYNQYIKPYPKSFSWRNLPKFMKIW